MEIFFQLFTLMFFGVAGFIVFVGFKMFQKNNEYKKQPKIRVYAKLIEKRTQVSNEFTYYFATFELDTGDRMELRLPGEKAGLIIEGDEGDLTFQGDRYIDFGYEKF